ncbi:MAG: hypothetical protein E4H28_00540 [Gemmatimonadales bacterium]|nr:MAG: hypothetical protein E4H28_00540 [Gemmatimonadales bacterium]
MTLRRIAGLLVLAGVFAAPPVAAQETGQPLTPGTEAPDFEGIASTRYGALKEPIRLSGFRGKTVVLAFFFRARTPG